MKKLLYTFIKNIENYKIYHIIIVFTIVFIIIFINNLYHIREELKTIASQNRILIVNEIDYTIKSWLEKRINYIEDSVKYLEERNHYQDEKETQYFIKTFQNNDKFDAVQVLVEDYYFYVNNEQYNDYRINPIFIAPRLKIEPIKTNWYLETKKLKKTTINIMDQHGFLVEKTMNLCSPILTNKVFKGVVCGIIKVSSIFKKIDELQFPQKAYYFIMNKEGTILTGIKTDKLKQEIEKTTKKWLTIEDKQNKLILKDDVITLTKFQDFDWYIGVGMSKKDIMHESTQKVTNHSMVLFLFFILLLIIINSAHTFIRLRVEKKQKEYEYLLAHRSRISEVGSLISSINHQFKQPLNGAALIVGNTLDMSERNILDKETLEDNLKLCQKSIVFMDKTIGIFRNFYQCNESITTFKLIDTIQGVLHVKYTDLSNNNINVKIIQNTDKDIYVTSIENYIQQILLVLIQNAKDALVSNLILDKKTNKTISLSFSSEEGKIYIDVLDYGGGISEEVRNTLFSEFKSSKKYEGSGIGLYFAQKLARQKLQGDIILVNDFSPTNFRLIFNQNLIPLRK